MSARKMKRPVAGIKPFFFDMGYTRRIDLSRKRCPVQKAKHKGFLYYEKCVCEFVLPAVPVSGAGRPGFAIFQNAIHHHSSLSHAQPL
jgi:hypothetical protein